MVDLRKNGLAALSALLMVASLASAAPVQERVTFSLSADPAGAAPGERFQVILEAKVQPGWHLYSMTQPEGGPIPTTIGIKYGDAFREAGEIVQPQVRTVYDENFDMDTEYLEGDGEFLIPMQVAEGAHPGSYAIEASVRFMACSDTMCLPPQVRTASVKVAVKAPSGGKAAAGPRGPLPSSAAQPASNLQTSIPAGGLIDPAKRIAFGLLHEEGNLAPGRYSQAELTVQVDPGWHLYSMTQPEGGPIPTTVELVESPAFLPSGPIEQPPFRTVFDKNFEMDAEYIDSGSFVIPFQVAEDAPDGRHRLQVKIRYMACSDIMCLPPQTEEFETAVTVLKGAQGGSLQAPSSAAKIETQGASQSGPEAVGGGGIPTTFWAYLGFSFLMGALALLTPCVFPMIPITVSYFTKRDAKTRGQAVWEAGLYAVGIILTFTALGFALTLALGAGGINRIASSPGVNLLIALIFIVFALSLFGALELRLPSSFINAIDRKGSNRGGVLGILAMALTFSLTSFTCTVPFVGTVMVAVLQGQWFWSLIGVTAFATAFSLPFFLLAVFPSWLKSLPQSGNWMSSMKVTLGFIELAAAMKFLSNIDLVYQWEILTRPVFITVWLAIALVSSAYLLGWFRFSHEAPSESIGAVRVFAAIFFLSVSFFLLRGLFGAPLGELDSFLPPRDYGGVSSQFALLGPGGEEHPRLKWHTNYQEALAEAKLEGKPVFIDFTGYTCTNCRWMEENMFVRQEVGERFRRMVLVRLYTDGPQEEHRLNQDFERERFKTIALPYYAILDADNRVLAEHPGLTRDPQEFVAFLDKAFPEEDRRLVLR